MSDPLPFARLHERDHPLRGSLTEEMHARKLPSFGTPTRLLQIVMLIEDGDVAASVDHLARIVPSLEEEVRFYACRIGDLDLAWERHGEFVTYTFIASAPRGRPFDAAIFSAAETWMEDAPGRLIRATKTELVDADFDLAPNDFLASLAVDDLVTCEIADGRARIWTDFRLHGDGSGRMLIVDRGLTGNEPRVVVQRLQELGNYRKMALLGLPAARLHTPRLTVIERRLAELTRQIADRKSSDEATLGELSQLSVELGSIVAETRHRLNATRAYADLCADRIQRLAVRPIAGHPSLTDFTERRLLPAVRTCDAFSRRLDDLSRRIDWTNSLLRTRVDIELAQQNRDLLASMDRRAELQLRLQQTVEGLSVVAISYYVIGLLGHLIKGLGPFGGVSQDFIIALLVPAVWIGVAVGLHSLKGRIDRSPERRSPRPERPEDARDMPSGSIMAQT